jgi:hypothetical protein
MYYPYVTEGIVCYLSVAEPVGGLVNVQAGQQLLHPCTLLSRSGGGATITCNTKASMT